MSTWASAATRISRKSVVRPSALYERETTTLVNRVTTDRRVCSWRFYVVRRATGERPLSGKSDVRVRRYDRLILTLNGHSLPDVISQGITRADRKRHEGLHLKR